MAFDDLAGPDALEVLRVAPTPTLGAGLSRSKIAAALRRGGRQRRVDERAAEIQAALRSEQLRAPDVVATAMGASVSASVAVIAEMAAQTAARLAEELSSGFEQHPDAEVVRSLPGLGTILGARVLGEFGDEPNRYATPKCRKNYAGTSPITRASGTKKTVLARRVRNRRLADAIYLWAFASLTASPGARAYYDARRAVGDGHHQALRALGNRLVGVHHGCLAHHIAYDESIAWAYRPANELSTAA
jgi:Transposase IS116/IS110/IS902 family